MSTLALDLFFYDAVPVKVIPGETQLPAFPNRGDNGDTDAWLGVIRTFPEHRGAPHTMNTVTGGIRT